MSEKHAKTLTQTSNRAKPKDAKEKKVVFKGVLDNPFRIAWPSIPVNLQNSMLAHITSKLEGAITSTPRLLRRKEKEAKRQKTTHTNEEEQPSELVQQSQVPLLLQHGVYGINQVTRRLESQGQDLRRPIIASTTSKDELAHLRCVFICREDLDPKILVDHIPPLVAAYNSRKPQECVRLITLPRGSELALAKVLGVRRVAVFAIDTNYPEFDEMSTLLERIPILTAPWLSHPDAGSSLTPTHIKLLRTTAPKDMKLSKETRTKERAEATKKRKLSQMVEEPK
ncbi:hypothetical protein CPC08DRAFT_681855 [Agrocybe pediades]|nr:hypothetical protein CPC08DRAFT_681855 [Agrocybe pediades]